MTEWGTVSCQMARLLCMLIVILLLLSAPSTIMPVGTICHLLVSSNSLKERSSKLSRNGRIVRRAQGLL